MPQDLIFAPVAAMALLTFIVLGFVPARRFRAAFARQVTAEDFRFGQSPAVPGHVSSPNRNYMNLLELPVLFYVAGLMYYVAGRLDQPIRPHDRAAVANHELLVVCIKGISRLCD